MHRLDDGSSLPNLFRLNGHPSIIFLFDVTAYSSYVVKEEEEKGTYEYTGSAKRIISEF
jgi:hypothetical protein